MIPFCEVHKFVDDTTLSELIPPPNSPPNMTDYLSSLLIWTADNDMQLNTSKNQGNDPWSHRFDVHPSPLNSSWPNPTR